MRGLLPLRLPFRSNDTVPRLCQRATHGIGTGLAVLELKLLARRITSAIALLSDGLESLVNVATAIATMLAVRYAARPVDRHHSDIPPNTVTRSRNHRNIRPVSQCRASWMCKSSRSSPRTF